MGPSSPAEPPHASPAETPRVGPWVALRTLAVMAWFSAMFFVLGPWLVLRAEGADLGARLAASSLPPRSAAAGVALLLVSQIVDFVRRGRGTPAPFDPPRLFIAEGVYRHTRNPMYLLYVAVMLVLAWLFRSPWLVLYAVGFFGLAHLYVRKVEEPGLRARFGASYERYCERVPRWLG